MTPPSSPPPAAGVTPAPSPPGPGSEPVPTPGSASLRWSRRSRLTQRPGARAVNYIITYGTCHRSRAVTHCFPRRCPPLLLAPAWVRARGRGCGGRSSTAPRLCSKGKGRQARSHHLTEGSEWGAPSSVSLAAPTVLTWTGPFGQGGTLRPREALLGPVHPRGQGPHHRPSGEPSCWVDPQTSGHAPRSATS